MLGRAEEYIGANYAKLCRMSIPDRRQQLPRLGR